MEPKAPASPFTETGKLAAHYNRTIENLQKGVTSKGSVSIKVSTLRQNYEQMINFEVEDNLVNQEVAIAMLETAGIECQIANNGQEALDKLNEANYDVVLMDCQMPVMDGYTTIREIRKKESTSGCFYPYHSHDSKCF